MLGANVTYEDLRNASHRSSKQILHGARSASVCFLQCLRHGDGLKFTFQFTRPRECCRRGKLIVLMLQCVCEAQACKSRLLICRWDLGNIRSNDMATSQQLQASSSLLSLYNVSRIRIIDETPDLDVPSVSGACSVTLHAVAKTS